MSGKENIIAEILRRGEAEKSALLEEANRKVRALEAEDAAFVADLERQTALDLAEEEKTILARRRSVAELDVRKLTLSAKQAAVSRAFAEAKARILALPDAEYRQFLRALLAAYAAGGDTVVVSKDDCRRFSQSEVSAFAKERGIKLGYRADGEFSGGLVLEGGCCDKNLTLDMLLAECRERAEKRVADLLFGG